MHSSILRCTALCALGCDCTAITTLCLWSAGGIWMRCPLCSGCLGPFAPQMWQAVFSKSSTSSARIWAPEERAVARESAIELMNMECGFKDSSRRASFASSWKRVSQNKLVTVRVSPPAQPETMPTRGVRRRGVCKHLMMQGCQQMVNLEIVLGRLGLHTACFAGDRNQKA